MSTSTMPRALRRAVALVALAGMLSVASSCSWLIMSAPPDPPVRSEPDCSTSRVPAVIDLSIGVPYLALGLIFLLAARSMDLSEDEGDAVQLGAGVVALTGGLYTWSGMSGLRMAGACREAEAEYEEWVNNPRNREPQRNPWETQPTRPGAERGMCVRGNTCDPGLTCASGFCVKLP
jgi:hypothetical protein